MRYLQKEDKRVLPFNNVLADSGRFAGDTLGYTRAVSSYSNNPFFSSYNSSTAAEVGQFIHDNSDFGGSAGSMTSTTVDLINTTGRTGADARYGSEFYINQITAGSGTAGGVTFPGGTRYLMTTVSGIGGVGMGGWITVFGWFRASGGTIGFRGGDVNLFKLNGIVMPNENYDLTTGSDWVNIMMQYHIDRGYISGFPFGLYGNNGNKIQIALVVVVAGKADIHTVSPVIGTNHGL